MVSGQIVSVDPRLGAAKASLDVPQALHDEIADFLAVFRRRHDDDGLYEVLETRLDYVKAVIREIETQPRVDAEHLAYVRDWFRQQTDAVLSQSRLMQRARTWPEGYPGDYLTLEAVYSNRPHGDGIGKVLDRYFLSRTLAVAVRSRLRTLCQLLAERSAAETAGARWLNLAAGSCRELLSIPPVAKPRRILCIDYDANALEYAKQLVTPHLEDTLTFKTDNAFRMANAARNIERYGEFTTIYSAGLFDYVKSGQLARLLAGLYGSLAKGGVLIAPFKDATRYDTFDYHWLVKWDFFLQRTEADIRAIFADAGVPRERLSVTRDDSGVILFFTATK